MRVVAVTAHNRCFMRVGVLVQHNLRMTFRPCGHRFVAVGTQLDGVIRYRQFTGRRVFSCQTVANFALDFDVGSTGPLGIPVKVAGIAVLGPPVYRGSGRKFRHDIRTVKAKSIERRIGQKDDPGIGDAQESYQQNQQPDYVFWHQECTM